MLGKCDTKLLLYFFVFCEKIQVLILKVLKLFGCLGERFKALSMNLL